MTARPTRRQHALLVGILLIAFALRVGYSFSQDPLAAYDRAQGDDQWWYLEYSYRQVTDIHMEPLSSAPLYLLWIGSVRYVLQPASDETVMLIAPEGGGLDIESVPGQPNAATVRVIWLVQALMSTATCYFAYRTARAISDEVRVGLVAAGVLALSLAMVISAAQIMTETTYIFLLSAGLMLVVEQGAGLRGPSVRVMALVGLLIGLASLTRAALLLFPVGLLIHAGLVSLWTRRTGQAPRFRWDGVVAMLTVYVLLHGLWTGWYYWRWNEVVIGAKGMSAFFYLGTQNDWNGPEDTDNALGATPQNPINDADYIDGAQQAIRANPTRYALGRVSNLARTYAQPYGTVQFAGPSLKALVRDWADDDRTLSGLLALTTQDGFFPKLMLYITHMGGIGLGLVGMVMSVRRWPAALPIAGFIAYVTLIHLVLLALPRYLFPTLPFWWVFGSVPLVAVVWRR